VSRRAHPDRLEAYYRRLLAVYPPRHRARYGEEMIGVLMASSAPGQRRPNLRESLDLVLSGLRARLGAGVGGDLSPAGRAAARVFGFLASVVLAALSWYEVAARIAWSDLPFGDPVPHPWLAQVPHRALAMGVGWTLVACACAARLRRVAALGAVFGLLGYAVIVGRGYDFAPDAVVSSWWLLTLTAFTAGCFVSLVRSAPAVDEAWPGDGEPSTVHDPSADARGGNAPGASGWRGVLRRDSDRVRPLGWRAVVALTAGALVTVGDPFLGRALVVVEPEGNGAWAVNTRSPNFWLPVFGNPYDHGPLRAVLLVVTLVVIVLGLRPAVRRRVLLLSAPVAGTVVLVQTAFQGFVSSGPRFTAYLTIGQWGALVLVPLLVFATGTWLLHRYEQRLASGALLT